MKIIVNDKPTNGAKYIGNGGYYYTPHYPEFVELPYAFRRETNNGTQVRNSLQEDWQFVWDLK